MDLLPTPFGMQDTDHKKVQNRNLFGTIYFEILFSLSMAGGRRIYGGTIVSVPDWLNRKADDSAFWAFIGEYLETFDARSL